MGNTEDRRKSELYVGLPIRHSLVSLRQRQPFLPDPGSDGVRIAAPLLGHLLRRIMIYYNLVTNLHLLLLRQILGGLALVFPDQNIHEGM